MSNRTITIGKADDGAAVKLDVSRLIVSRMLVTASSGGGKSYLLRKILEGVSKTTQTIVVDTEGEFASLREKRDMVLAGPAGEAPADPRSAGLLCRRLMELNLSAVVDVSDLARSDKRQFVARFIDTLVDLPRALWRPCVLTVDELHEFAPEGEKTDSGRAISLLASKGRKRGYCLLGATQRLQKLDKDVAAELKNVFIGQMVLDVDLRRAADFLGMSKDRWSDIRDLSPPDREGEFFGFGPALSHRGVLKFRGGEVETTHPRAGQGRLAEPPAPSEKIRGVLEELKDLPQQAEAEIKDLQAAKGRIAQLERELKAKPVTPADPAAVDRVVQRAVEQQKRQDAAVIGRLRQGLEQAMKIIADVTAKGFDATGVDPEQVRKAVEAATGQIVKLVEQRLATRNSEMEKFKKEATTLLAKLQKLLNEDVNVQVSVQHNEPFTVQAASRPRQPAYAEDDDLGSDGSTFKISGNVAEGAPEWMQPAHQKILNAMAWLATFGLTEPDRGVVAAMAGASPTSSSYTNNISRLKTAELIEYPQQSGLVRLTDAGAALAATPTKPPSLRSLHAAWRRCPAFDPAHVRILDAVIAQYPEAMTREDLAVAAEASPTSSSFSNNVSRLSSLGLVEYPQKGLVKATSLLFPEGLL